MDIDWSAIERNERVADALQGMSDGLVNTAISRFNVTGFNDEVDSAFQYLIERAFVAGVMLAKAEPELANAALTVSVTQDEWGTSLIREMKG